MKFSRIFFIVFILLNLLAHFTNAQIADTTILRKLYLSKDTVRAPKEENPAFKETDSIKLKNPNYLNPRTAALRSAIIPGWGQIYNKKGWLWKVPIVYGVLGGTGYYFFFNLKWYKQFRLGYKVAYNMFSASGDSTGYNNIDPYLIDLVKNNRLQTLKYYRDSYRRDLDYSAVYFALAWILNIVQASVDAHLSSFDVSPNFTFKIEPGYSQMAKTNGVSLILKFK